MREALNLKLQLIHLLAGSRANLLQQVQNLPAGTPTKVGGALSVIKAALTVLGGKLSDPEPSPVAYTEEQIALASIRNAEVAIRTVRFKENLEKLEAALMVDHAGQPVMDWTDKEKAKALAYIEREIVAIQQAIDDLV